MKKKLCDHVLILSMKNLHVALGLQIVHVTKCEMGLSQRWLAAIAVTSAANAELVLGTTMISQFTQYTYAQHLYTPKKVERLLTEKGEIQCMNWSYMRQREKKGVFSKTFPKVHPFLSLACHPHHKQRRMLKPDNCHSGTNCS